MPRLIGASQVASFSDKINTFTSSGTFTSSPATTTVDYLVVAGGGGGGSGTDGAYNGGSGVVIIKDPKGTFTASSVWDLKSVFRNVKAGTWS